MFGGAVRPFWASSRLSAFPKSPRGPAPHSATCQLNRSHGMVIRPPDEQRCGGALYRNRRRKRLHNHMALVQKELRRPGPTVKAAGRRSGRPPARPRRRPACARMGWLATRTGQRRSKPARRAVFHATLPARPVAYRTTLGRRSRLLSILSIASEAQGPLFLPKAFAA
jgi:hypothetical protein